MTKNNDKKPAQNKTPERHIEKHESFEQIRPERRSYIGDAILNGDKSDVTTIMQRTATPPNPDTDKQ